MLVRIVKFHMSKEGNNGVFVQADTPTKEATLVLIRTRIVLNNIKMFTSN